MGFTSRRPILPAPTDSLLESADETGLGTDLGTDLSRRTDKTWEEIPGDGTPITISPAPKHNHLGKLPKSGQHSQTSLLIELFESNKTSESGQRRPSLRVRYTPSKSRKKGEKAEGHILVTESKSTRKPSKTHRIALGGNETLAHNIIEGSISSLDSAGNLHPKAPVEIDVHQDDASDFSSLSASPELKYIIPESDISSMPPESSLGVANPIIMSQSEQSSLPRGSSHDAATLKPPVIITDRNASNERITQKVIEKLSNKPRGSASGKRRRSSQTPSHSSVSREVEADEPGEPRAYVAKKLDDDSNPSATGSSVISGSHLSAEPRATDQRSVRSGTSNVSITNNPKLLQTVEDAIRRLILPELTELRRDQRHHRSRHEKHEKLSEPSDISSSNLSREERTHRKSSGSKSRRRVSHESDGAKPSSSSRRHRSHRYDEYDSPSEQSYDLSESVESSSIRDEERKKSHKSSKSHRVRDVAAGALGGAALTAAALKSHDSGSSLEYSEKRRRRRSKSRSSRSASVTEKEDAFSKHKVPPMPFVSEIGTDLTRSSLQSSIDGGATTPTRREVREVIRGSPLDMSSPGSRTPTKGNLDIKRGLGTHHGNFSEHDLSGHDISTRKEMLDDGSELSHEVDESDFATHGFAALTDPERARAYERNLHQQHPIRRGLSPIQSVASYATTTEPGRNSFMQARSSESLNSLKKQERSNDQISISTLSSPPSTDLARSMRPHGISLENRSEIMGQHQESLESTPRQVDADAVFDEQHLENESYRKSPYVDKVTAGRHVAKPLGATAEIMELSTGVESAVASLISNSGSPRHSQASSLDRHESDALDSPYYDRDSRYVSSPLKHESSMHSNDKQILQPAAIVRSPAQSPAHSLARSLARSAQHSEGRSAKSIHSPNLPSPEITTQAERSPESDITTNPSVIQGPIGGLSQGNTDHWPYDPTPPRSRADLVLPPVSRDIGSAGADLIPEALTISHNHDLDPKRDLYMKAQPLTSSPGAKDEGYETGANARSPGLYSQPRGLHDDSFTPDLHMQDADLGDDPFTITRRDQYADGLSHAMSPSPMFDGLIDPGRDQIQSRDIVKLMDHLTVRDAQRNARDTEILVTLVRSAAEMRNSFEDMKKFIAEQDEQMLDNAERQHERTQKLVSGPRPQPMSTSRTAHSATSEDDLPNKRGNVFRRALRGLSTKNTHELQNIEAMVMRLLDEVEGLRATQNPGIRRDQMRNTSLTSDNARAPTDTGYEPEGQAGTSSTGDRSGFFSNNSSRQADYRNYNLRDSGNRVSTVMEDNEEYDDYDAQLGPANAGNVQASHTPLDTPPRQEGRHVRGGSAPLHTPPRTIPQNFGPQSHENTPQQSTGDGSSRKHKSFASNFIPKMVSRWSKTTASSADNFRSSEQSHRPHSQISRSGSNLGEYAFDHDHHDPQGDVSFQREHYPEDYDDDDHGRPPSPLIPSQLSDNPKYKAHRNSVNLQHPQPRQGPTDRFQSRLESEAQHYNDQLSPASQTSSQWDQGSSVQRTMPPHSGYGEHLSPIPDNPYSTEPSVHHDNRSIRSGTSSQGPPRPPKISNDEPLVPQRPPKVPMSPSQANRQPTYVDHVAAARAGSPAFDKVRLIVHSTCVPMANKPTVSSRCAQITTELRKKTIRTKAPGRSRRIEGRS